MILSVWLVMNLSPLFHQKNLGDLSPEQRQQFRVRSSFSYSVNLTISMSMHSLETHRLPCGDPLTVSQVCIQRPMAAKNNVIVVRVRSIRCVPTCRQRDRVLQSEVIGCHNIYTLQRSLLYRSPFFPLIYLYTF